MQQRGFTLVELIIVIVILGILAVTAAPRFIDLQGDARASTLDGVKAALQGGAQLVYAKSAIEGEQKNANANDATTQVSINGQTVETDFGYPDAELATLTTINGWADLSSTDWDILIGTGGAGAGTPAAGTFVIFPAGGAYHLNNNNNDQCQVLYTEAPDAITSPVITVQGDGC